jgi:multidrug efflux pump subunit AcrA (membrane-fusion protein)
MQQASDLFREEAVEAHARWLSLVGSPRIAPIVSAKVWIALVLLVLCGVGVVAAISLLSGRVSLVGTLVPVGDHSRVLTASADGGTVLDVDAVEGQHVTRGDVLLRISNPASTESTVLVAPMNGILVALGTRTGDAPHAGQLLATIEADDAEIEARFSTSRRVVAGLKPGQQLALRVDNAGTDSVVAGVIDRVWQPPAGSGDGDAVNVAVKLSQRPSDLIGIAPDLLAGLHVEARLPLALPAWLQGFRAASASTQQVPHG